MKKKIDLQKLKYSAVYDYEAALRLADIYLKGEDVSRDKYKALEYYRLFQQLSEKNQKPVSSEKKDLLDRMSVEVKEELRKSLKLNDALESTLKSKARKVTSTGTLRRSLGLVGLLDATGSRLASFLTVFNIYAVYKVFSKIPLLSTVLLSTQIALDTGIVVKNGLKQAVKEANDPNANLQNSIEQVGKQVKLSLKKDGRLLRMFGAGVWISIAVGSMIFAAAAAPLLVAGSIFDLVMTTVGGIRNHSALRKEQAFIDSELAQVNEKLDSLNRDGDNSQKDWLLIKQGRLTVRQSQLSAAINRNYAKGSAEMMASGALLLGAALLIFPNPITQILGLVTVGLGGLAYCGLKFFFGMNKVNVSTAPSLSANELNESSQANDHHEDVTHSSSLMMGHLAGKDLSAAQDDVVVSSAGNDVLEEPDDSELPIGVIAGQSIFEQPSGRDHQEQEEDKQREQDISEGVKVDKPSFH